MSKLLKFEVGREKFYDIRYDQRLNCDVEICMIKDWIIWYKILIESKITY